MADHREGAAPAPPGPVRLEGLAQLATDGRGAKQTVQGEGPFEHPVLPCPLVTEHQAGGVLPPPLGAFSEDTQRLLYCRRSEEHTSELQSHSFISYAVF